MTRAFTPLQRALIAQIDVWCLLAGLRPYSEIAAERAPIDPDTLPAEVVCLDAEREERAGRRVRRGGAL